MEGGEEAFGLSRSPPSDSRTATTYSNYLRIFAERRTLFKNFHLLETGNI